MTLKSSGELIAVYSYDALGRRIQKVVTNSGSLDGTTDYYYDGQQDIEEHNGAGTLTQQYVYGNDINEVLVIDRNLTGGPTATARATSGCSTTRTLWAPSWRPDGHRRPGSSRPTSTTPTAARRSYRPGPAASWSSVPGRRHTRGSLSLVGNPFLFTGRGSTRRDGTLLRPSRDSYNPDQSQFIQRDPLGFRHAIQSLRYAHDQLVRYTDPNGTIAWWVAPCLLGALVGVGTSVIGDAANGKLDLCHTTVSSVINALLGWPPASCSEISRGHRCGWRMRRDTSD